VIHIADVGLFVQAGTEAGGKDKTGVENDVFSGKSTNVDSDDWASYPGNCVDTAGLFICLNTTAGACQLSEA
jgi:hypothetical protein